MLALYRRHRQNCKAGHPRQFANTEYDERKKGWKRCDCNIFVSGSLQGKFKRTTTGEWEWERAHAVADRWEAAGSWNAAGPILPEVTAPPVETPKQRVMITDAITAFLLQKETASVKKHTVAKYRTMTNQLSEFATKRGYVYLDQLSIMDVDQFYISWKDGIRTRAKKLDRLKSFVKFCLKRKWITENLAEDLKAPEGSSIPKQKTPFSDDDIKKLIDACDKVKRSPRCDWDGEDLKDFIYFAIYTGLRISDITLFDIDKRLNGNDIVVRALKNGALVSTWCPTWLIERLHRRKQSHGSLIFRVGKTTNPKQMTQIWRDRRLREVFKYAGQLSVANPSPHLCRHTFVRILLERGVSVEDVAELIGDKPETVRRFYSAWLPGRQRRLSAILRDAFGGRTFPAGE
jgi:integrase